MKMQPLYVVILKFYAIFEYAIVAYFLMSILQNNLVKSIIKYSVPVFIVIALYYYFIVAPNSFNKYPSVIEVLLFIGFIIYFFYEKMKTVIIYPLYQSITFWICVAFFLYFAGNFFFFLFNDPKGTPEFKNQMKIIYSVVTITKDIILSLALFANEPVEDTDDELHVPSGINLDEFTLTNTKNF